MRKSVLIADDNPMIRKRLCDLLEAALDYDLCGQAVNGAEAIVLAGKLNPDLIILDFSMPVMNGLDAARALKKLMPAVPIILFTQHANVVENMPANELPFDMIVAKADASLLMKHVRSLIPA
jgi:chemotaxis response regulator CheB